MESMRCLDCKDAEACWDKDENGEKGILRSGLEKTQIAHNRIKVL